MVLLTCSASQGHTHPSGSNERRAGRHPVLQMRNQARPPAQVVQTAREPAGLPHMHPGPKRLAGLPRARLVFRADSQCTILASPCLRTASPTNGSCLSAPGCSEAPGTVHSCQEWVCQNGSPVILKWENSGACPGHRFPGFPSRVNLQPNAEEGGFITHSVLAAFSYPSDPSSDSSTS